MDSLAVPKIDKVIPLNVIEQLIKSVYLIECDYVKKLCGYDDQNFEIKCKKSQQKFIVKVTNKTESKDNEFIEAQNCLMFHFAKNDIKAPVPIPIPILNPISIKTSTSSLNKGHYLLEQDKSYYTFYDFGPDDRRIVRLLEYQEGISLAESNRKDPTDSIFNEIGKLAAKVSLSLEHFQHRGYKRKNSIWMLENVSEIKKYIVLTLPNKKLESEIVQDVISEFEINVLTIAYPKLKKQIIHGDINEQNILIKLDETRDGRRLESLALLDFADSHFSCSFFDLTILSAYMVLHTESIDCLVAVLAGFQSLKPIADFEFEILKVCIEARLCQSLILGLYTHQLNPVNNYVLTTQEACWKMLKVFRQIDNQQFIKMFQ